MEMCCFTGISAQSRKISIKSCFHKWCSGTNRISNSRKLSVSEIWELWKCVFYEHPTYEHNHKIMISWVMLWCWPDNEFKKIAIFENVEKCRNVLLAPRAFSPYSSRAVTVSSVCVHDSWEPTHVYKPSGTKQSAPLLLLRSSSWWRQEANCRVSASGLRECQRPFLTSFRQLQSKRD